MQDPIQTLFLAALASAVIGGAVELIRRTLSRVAAAGAKQYCVKVVCNDGKALVVNKVYHALDPFLVYGLLSAAKRGVNMNPREYYEKFLRRWDGVKVCPNGHGPLREWEGKTRCWKCGHQAVTEGTHDTAATGSTKPEGLDEQVAAELENVRSAIEQCEGDLMRVCLINTYLSFRSGLVEELRGPQNRERRPDCLKGHGEFFYLENGDLMGCRVCQTPTLAHPRKVVIGSDAQGINSFMRQGLSVDAGEDGDGLLKTLAEERNAFLAKCAIRADEFIVAAGSRHVLTNHRFVVLGKKPLFAMTRAEVPVLSEVSIGEIAAYSCRKE